MDLARASAKLFVARSSNAVVGFAGLTYFAWELGAGPLGVFFLYSAVVAVLGVPADAGLSGAVEKRISEGDRPREHLSAGVALKAVVVGVVLLAVWIAGPAVDGYVGRDVTAYVVLGVALQEGARLAKATLKGELRVGATASIELGRQLAWVVTGVLLVEHGLGATGLIVGKLAGWTVALLWSVVRCSVVPGLPGRDDAVSVVEFASYNAVSSLSTQVFGWVDVLVIGVFWTDAQVGAYEVAWRVASVTFLLSRSIGTALFPQVSSWDARRRSERIATTLRDAITPSMVLVLPALFGAAVVGRELLGVVFGPEFVVAWLALVVLLADKTVASVNVLLDNTLRGIDRPDLVAYAKLATVLVNLLLNVALVPRFGIAGAAAATALSGLFLLTVTAHLLSRFVAIDVRGREVGWCVLSAALMAGALVPVRRAFDLGSPVPLALTVAAGALVYGVAVLSFPPIRARVRLQVRSLRSGGSGAG